MSNPPSYGKFRSNPPTCYTLMRVEQPSNELYTKLKGNPPTSYTPNKGATRQRLIHHFSSIQNNTPSGNSPPAYHQSRTTNLAGASLPLIILTWRLLGRYTAKLQYAPSRVGRQSDLWSRWLRPHASEGTYTRGRRQLNCRERRISLWQGPRVLLTHTLAPSTPPEGRAQREEPTCAREQPEVTVKVICVDGRDYYPWVN